MDLQAILDASSDSSGGGITIDGIDGLLSPSRRGGGASGGGAGKGADPPAGRPAAGTNHELERILRDAEEEELDDDDGYGGRYGDPDERREHGGGRPPSRTSGGDRLLQSILDEDSDSDGDDGVGLDGFRGGGGGGGGRRGVAGSSVADVVRPSPSPRGRGRVPALPMSHSMEVEAILNSRDEDDGDDDGGYPDGLGPASSDAIRRMVSGISLRGSLDDSDGGDSDDVGFNLNFAPNRTRPVPDGTGDMAGQHPLRESSPWTTSGRDAGSGGTGPSVDGAARRDDDAGDGARGDGAGSPPPPGLLAAEAGGRALLASGAGRPVVSPLGVKRRMKAPRVELMTRSRGRGDERGAGAAGAGAAPRFGMSNGVIRCRSMSGLGSQLLVQVSFLRFEVVSGLEPSSFLFRSPPYVLANPRLLIKPSSQRTTRRRRPAPAGPDSPPPSPSGPSS